MVRRTSVNVELNIYPISNGGVADSAAQMAFCKGSDCVIQVIWDQSPYGNHLKVAPAGGHVNHSDMAVNASRMPLTLGGANIVYAAYFEVTCRCNCEL